MRETDKELFNESINDYLDNLKGPVPVVSYSHNVLNLLYNKYGRGKVDSEISKRFKEDNHV